MVEFVFSLFMFIFGCTDCLFLLAIKSVRFYCFISLGSSLKILFIREEAGGGGERKTERLHS